MINIGQKCSSYIAHVYLIQFEKNNKQNANKKTLTHSHMHNTFSQCGIMKSLIMTI